MTGGSSKFYKDIWFQANHKCNIDINLRYPASDKRIAGISLASEIQGLPVLLLTKESRVGETITADMDFLALMLFLGWTCRITQMVVIPVRY